MDDRSRRVERAFQVPVLVAAALVVPVLALQSAELDGAWLNVVFALDWMIWGVLAAELVAMLVVVPHRRAWLRAHRLDVAIVLLTVPAFTTAVSGLRALRLLPLVHLVQLPRIASRVFTVSGLRYVALVALLTALAGGETFGVLEDRSPAEGLYWALSTMTTVGYGDVVPDTDGGRALAVVVMLVGIGFVAVLTGALARRFLGGNGEHAADAAGAPSDHLRNELADLRAAVARIESRLG